MKFYNSIVSYIIKRRVHQIDFFKKFPLEVQKDLFFELIQAHNELVFFKRESLVISLNSKERVDESSHSELSGYR